MHFPRRSKVVGLRLSPLSTKYPNLVIHFSLVDATHHAREVDQLKFSQEAHFMLCTLSAKLSSL
jgi:hypothetical protein